MPGLCGGADVSASRNGTIYFDTENQVAMGQSLGSFTSGIQASSDPMPYKGYVGTGAGSYGMEFVFNLAVLPGKKPLGNLLEPLFFYTSVNDIVKDRAHPVWALSSMMLADADFSHSFAQWQRSEQTEVIPNHTLLVEGFFDDWVGNDSQRKLIRALQSDLVGPELNVQPERSVVADNS